MKVYLIHSGCIHEGGGVWEKAFFKKTDARNEIINYLKSKEPEDEEYRQFLLKKNMIEDFDVYKEVEPNLWEKGSDIIFIKEVDLI